MSTYPDEFKQLEERIEQLQAENWKLRKAIIETLEENGHLADGDDCTLIKLKQALEGFR